MDLKYISKNNGYIIGRKLENSGSQESNVFKTKGNLNYSEEIPENEQIKKGIIEFTFDTMKDKVIKDYKARYFLSDDDISSFYFEGKLEKDSNSFKYEVIGGKEVPCYKTVFDIDFEVEMKVNPKNYFIVQYDNFKLQK